MRKFSIYTLLKIIALTLIFGIYMIIIHHVDNLNPGIYPNIERYSSHYIISNEIYRIPNEFQIVEQLFSLGNSLTLVSDGKMFSKLYKPFFSLENTHYLFDSNGHLVAIAKKKIFSWVTDICFVDCNGKIIGKLLEEMSWTSVSSLWSSYIIYDEHDVKLFTVKKSHLLNLHYEFRDIHESVVATLSRDVWRWGFGHLYNVKVLDQTAIDYRIIALLSSFQTSYERSKNLRHKSSKSKGKLV